MAPQQSTFRQVDEKHVPVEVHCMEWNPKMDLIALSNIQGEVYLQRLSWQRVWTLAPHAEHTKVAVLSWRPDGKVLAVGYCTGWVSLVDVENADVIHSFSTHSPVLCMSWSTEKPTEGDTVPTVLPIYQDQSAKYLPKLPPLSKSYIGSSSSKHTEESPEDTKKLKDQVNLNILVVGCENATVHLLAYGIFPVALLNLADHSEKVKHGKLASATLTSDLQMLSILLECAEPNMKELYFYSFNMDLLCKRHMEIQILASKFGQISSLMAYLDATITAMTEAWEDILLEMDLKLAKFAEEKAKLDSGSVSDDFLQLLMFGTCSAELQQFLLYELTEKGLKKLGHSLETSYSNVQKLVLKHLQSVTQALAYHLGDVMGMAQWKDKFGALGLTPENLQVVSRSVGSFMLKATELQQVIDNSMKNFKAFFRWLYVVILRLSDETPMAEINKVTQQDLAFVAEFLKESFTEEQSVPPQVKTEVSSDQAKPSFHLERVGQYLKDEPLHFPPDTSTNPWEQVLSENANLRDHKSHFPHDTKKSLIQQYSELKRILDDVFDQPAFVIGKTFSVSASRLLFRSTDANSNLLGRVTQLNSAGSSLLTTFMLKQSSCATKALHMLKQTTGDPSSLSVMVVHFGPIRSQDDSVTSPAPAMASELHVVKDVRYYDEDTMSVLLHQETADAVPILAQVPLCELKSWSSVGGAADLTQCLQTLVPVDGSHLLNPTNCRCLENMKAAALAVSGTRKVACVLFMSRKRVRLFEMDVEDEEEDEEEEESLDMADESKIDISGTKSPSDDDKENVS